MMSSIKVENSELFRLNIRKKLNEIIGDDKKSNNLEKGIFNYTLKESERQKVVKKWDNKYFVHIYVYHLRSVISNLKGENLENIKNGTMKPHSIAFMTHQELCPDKWTKLIDEKSKRDKHKFETNITASTDTFTCRKCRGNQCTYYQMQTRSADEPMTTFVTCLTCGNRFKC